MSTATVRYDKELEEFRNLMKVPSTFEEGFSYASLIGAVFVAMLMVPGAMYMQLLAGQGIGPAAQWVTVILFLEVARRAHKRLRRPELFVLFYMAGAAMGQPFQGLLLNQFFVQSQSATGSGVAEWLPNWFAPSSPEVLAQRNFFDPAWYPAIGIIVFTQIVGRINSTILTYGLFRVASDIEKLPFPMAPIGAAGIMALAEQQVEESSSGAAAQADGWRWRVFSIGGILGLSFGAVYTALPALSTAILNQPISILPIPFVDLTPKTADFLPAVPTGINLNLGLLVTGMVMPFFAILGSFVGLIITMVANPMLYRSGLLSSWSPGDRTPMTLFKNQMDFYFSFSIGISIAIALAGFWQVFTQMRAKKKLREEQKRLRLEVEKDVTTPPGRGDIPTPIIIVTYAITSMAYILVSGYLIDWHPGVMKVLMFFAFLYTPIISYVTARLEGLAGQVVQIPMVREAAFILSGYTGGVKVWFLPTPMADYGQGTVFWRQAELTGTKFWSIWKAEVILVPIVMVASIFFAQFIWSLAVIPGPEYPFTEVMWEQQAASQCIIYSATLGRFSTWQESFNWIYLVFGAGFGTVLFAVMWPLHLPILLIYGIIRGLGQTLPHAIVPEFIGALIGRYYFQRRIGKMWRQYILVAAAGFHCGMGLISVLSIGLNFLAKSVIKIPF
ncbi:MAG: OPT/YSL family transporter [Phycisphaerae bacterium]